MDEYDEYDGEYDAEGYEEDFGEPEDAEYAAEDSMGGMTEEGTEEAGEETQNGGYGSTDGTDEAEETDETEETGEIDVMEETDGMGGTETGLEDGESGGKESE